MKRTRKGKEKEETFIASKPTKKRFNFISFETLKRKPYLSMEAWNSSMGGTEEHFTKLEKER